MSRPGPHYLSFSNSEGGDLTLLHVDAHTPVTLNASHVTLAMLKVNPQFAHFLGSAPGLTFPSLSHVWAALGAHDAATAARFSVDGDLGRWDDKIFAIIGMTALSFKAWRKRRAIGVLARYVADQRYMHLFGLDRLTPIGDLLHLTRAEALALWTPLLTLKFEQSRRARASLFSTHGYQLVLLQGMQPSANIWDAYFDAHGHLVGENRMGIYLDLVRDTLLRRPLAIDLY